MSAKWRRYSKNKLLDFNKLTKQRTKTSRAESQRRSKSISSSSSFRPIKSFTKHKWQEPKPLIDIFQENNWITIIAQITGFNRETVKINVKDQKLTLSAKSKDRRYYKSLNLPKVVIPNVMHTKFKNGVLEIKLKTLEKTQTINKEAD